MILKVSSNKTHNSMNTPEDKLKNFEEFSTQINIRNKGGFIVNVVEDR